MNYNPFELRKNDLNVVDMYETNEYGWMKANKFDEEYGSYEYLLKGINTNIDWKVVCYTGSYQGELYCFGDCDGKYYYVKTGYGSCSGCDWYQAKEGSFEGLQEVQDGLKRDIKEFESIEEFLEYFNKDEISGWYRDEAEEFLKEFNKVY